MVVENVIFTRGHPRDFLQLLCKATKTKPHFPLKVQPKTAPLYASMRYIFFASLPPLFPLLTTPEKGRNCPFSSPEISLSPATMPPFPASLAYTIIYRGELRSCGGGGCEPLLVSARTGSGYSYRPVVVRDVTSTGPSADQYWSKNYPCGARSQSLWLCRRLLLSSRC